MTRSLKKSLQCILTDVRFPFGRWSHAGCFFHGPVCKHFVHNMRWDRLKPWFSGGFFDRCLVPMMKDGTGRCSDMIRTDQLLVSGRDFQRRVCQGYLLQNPIPVETQPENWELSPYLVTEPSRLPDFLREDVNLYWLCPHSA